MKDSASPDRVPDDYVVLALATLVEIARHGKTAAGRMAAAAALAEFRGQSN